MHRSLAGLFLHVFDWLIAEFIQVTIYLFNEHIFFMNMTLEKKMKKYI